MAIDATPGSASANSYATVSESNTYFSTSKGREAWSDVDTPDKENLLVEATRILDLYFDWFGSIDPNSQQSLRWPRDMVFDVDNRKIDPLTVPKTIKYATFELAYHLYSGTGFSVDQNPLEQLRVGPIRLDFSDQTREPVFPKIVSDMLLPMGFLKIASANQVRTAKLVRT